MNQKLQMKEQAIINKGVFKNGKKYYITKFSLLCIRKTHIGNTYEIVLAMQLQDINVCGYNVYLQTGTMNMV